MDLFVQISLRFVSTSQLLDNVPGLVIGVLKVRIFAELK